MRNTPPRMNREDLSGADGCEMSHLPLAAPFAIALEDEWTLFRVPGKEEPRFVTRVCDHELLSNLPLNPVHVSMKLPATSLSAFGKFTDDVPGLLIDFCLNSLNRSDVSRSSPHDRVGQNL